MNTLLRTLLPMVLLGLGCARGPSARVRVRAPAPPVSIDVIQRLAEAGISDSVILDEIRARGMSARPTVDEIVALKKDGLGDAVLQAMNEAPLGSVLEALGESAAGP